MKKFYTDPEAAVILLQAEDILTESAGATTEDEGNDPDKDQGFGDDPFVD